MNTVKCTLCCECVEDGGSTCCYCEVGPNIFCLTEDFNLNKDQVASIRGKKASKGDDK